VRLHAYEREGETGDKEGQEKNRQKTLSGASKSNDVTFNGVECLGSTGLAAISNLQRMTTRLYRRLDRVVHRERINSLPIYLDVVRATTDLNSNCFMRYFECCGHH
jgi:hypothetical protein